MVSGSGDKKIRLWNVSDGKLLKTLYVSFTSNSLEMLPGGNLIAGLNHGLFEIFDIQTESLIKRVKHHSGGIYSLLNFRNKYLISAGTDKIIKVFEF